MKNTDFYRRQATLAKIEVEVIKSQLLSTNIQLNLIEEALQEAMKENARLRTIVEYMGTQLNEVYSHLREAKSNSQQITIKQLIRSLLIAIESGSNETKDLVITRTKADIRVPLQVNRDTLGVYTESPGIFSSEALSTISVDIKTSPPTLYEESRRGSLGEIRLAILNLQASLDHELPSETKQLTERIIAWTGEFVTNPLMTPESVKIQLEVLVTSLNSLSRQLPCILTSTKILSDFFSSLPPSPTNQDLNILAKAIDEVASSLKEY